MASDQLGIHILGPTYFGARQVGLRGDKKAEDVVPEQPEDPPEDEPADEVKISSADRVIFPDSGQVKYSCDRPACVMKLFEYAVWRAFVLL